MSAMASILNTIPYEELIGLYGTLHEADIEKSYKVLDSHFSKSESKLKSARKLFGLTQKALADKCDVSELLE